jgi:hypothetical protein
MSVSLFPSSSRTLFASTLTSNESGSARRDVTASTSMAVHPPIAASSSSVGLKSTSSPVPVTSRPPRLLTIVN